MEKESLIKKLIDCEAIQRGHFVLTSGAISDYYIDIKKASTNPTILKQIAKHIAPYTKGYDLLAGMEMGAIPLLVAVSLNTDLPYVIVRKEKKGHGTDKKIEGTSVEGKKVLIIEDVTTSGGSVINTIQILKQQKAILKDVVVVVDRESGADEKISKNGLTFYPLLQVQDILKR